MKWISDGAIQHLRLVTDLPDLSDTKYRLREEIARGGMGTVYLADDLHLHREVAIKVLSLPHANPTMAARMLREAHIIARLEHPGIVPIHDVGHLADGRMFYAMKLVRGHRLDEHLQLVTTSLPERLRILKAVTEAVAFAHAHGVIHRDLKPQNIMVGSFGEVLVMDWGVAKPLYESDQPSERSYYNDICDQKSTLVEGNTARGTVLGTRGYMAPEQERGETDQIDQRTDVYALGALLYFLLNGEHPPPATYDRSKDSLGTPVGHVMHPKTDKALKAICAKAASKDPAGRYPSALALAADITSFLEGGAVSAYRENLLEKAGRWASKNRFLLFLVLAYLLMRLIFLFLYAR